MYYIHIYEYYEYILGYDHIKIQSRSQPSALWSTVILKKLFCLFYLVLSFEIV